MNGGGGLTVIKPGDTGLADGAVLGPGGFFQVARGAGLALDKEDPVTRIHLECLPDHSLGDPARVALAGRIEKVVRSGGQERGGNGVEMAGQDALQDPPVSQRVEDDAGGCDEEEVEQLQQRVGLVEHVVTKPACQVHHFPPTHFHCDPPGRGGHRVHHEPLDLPNEAVAVELGLPKQHHVDKEETRHNGESNYPQHNLHPVF